MLCIYVCKGQRKEVVVLDGTGYSLFCFSKILKYILGSGPVSVGTGLYGISLGVSVCAPDRQRADCSLTHMVQDNYNILREKNKQCLICTLFLTQSRSPLPTPRRFFLRHP